MVIREELLKPVIFEQRHEGVRDEVEEPCEYPEKIIPDREQETQSLKQRCACSLGTGKESIVAGPQR